MNPAVSIIIPVYNTADFLRACLDSILSQSCRDLEVICVDDGSTDGSTQILQRAARNDERLQLIKQENRGASVARNRGIDAAAGEFLAFADSDDLYLPLAFERLLAEARRARAEIAVGSHVKVEAASGKKHPRTVAPAVLDGPATLDAILDARILWTVWGKLFSRSLFLEHDLRFPVMQHNANDIFTVCQAAYFSRKTVCIAPVVYQYNARRHSLSRSDDHHVRVTNSIRAYSQIARFIQAQDQWPRYAENFRRRSEKYFRRELKNLVNRSWTEKQLPIRSFFRMCREGLPEFNLSETEAAESAMHALGAAWSLPAARRAQTVRYVAEYLAEIPKESFSPKVRDIAEQLISLSTSEPDRKKLDSLLKPFLPPQRPRWRLRHWFHKQATRWSARFRNSVD